MWFHVEAPGKLAARSGLTALLVMTFALTAAGPARSFGAVAARRAGRLLVPWLFWCVPYAILLLQRAVRRDLPIGVDCESWMLWVGPAIHLWFLPFAFAGAMLTEALRRPLMRLGGIGPIAAAGLLGAAVMAVTARSEQFDDLDAPLFQWNIGAAAIPLGLALGLAIRQAGPPRRRAEALLAAVLPGMTVGVVLDGWGWAGIPLNYLVALGLAAPLTFWRRKTTGLLRGVADLSFGVYLVHPAFLKVYSRVCPWADTSVLDVALVLLLSAAAAYLLLRSPLRRFST